MPATERPLTLCVKGRRRHEGTEGWKARRHEGTKFRHSVFAIRHSLGRGFSERPNRRRV